MPDKGLLPADLSTPRNPCRLIAETYVPHWARFFTHRHSSTLAGEKSRRDNSLSFFFDLSAVEADCVDYQQQAFATRVTVRVRSWTPFNLLSVLFRQWNGLKTKLTR